MKTEFDATEGREVRAGTSARSVLVLLPVFLSATFFIAVWFIRAGIGSYGQSEIESVRLVGILYVASLSFVWLSVAIVHMIEPSLFRPAAKVATIITILWIPGYFLGTPQPGV